MTNEKLTQAIALINSGDSDPFKTTVISLLLEIIGDLKEMRDRLDDFESAFPDQDTDAHRKYHEKLIEDAADRKKTELDVKSKVTSGLVWSGLTGIGIAIWEWLKHEVKK